MDIGAAVFILTRVDFSGRMFNDEQMRLVVKVKPAAREEKVENRADGSLFVSVKEPPIQGRANAAVCRVLAAHFGVSFASVRILSGHTSRTKIVEVDAV